MQWAVVAVMAFLISACGGNAPAPVRTGAAVHGSQYLLQHVPKGSYVITKKEFPEVYAAASQQDYLKVHELLGAPRNVSFGIIGTPPNAVIFVGPSRPGPEGDRIIGEVLLYQAVQQGDVSKARDLINQRRLAMGRPAEAGAYTLPPVHWTFDERATGSRQRELTELMIRSGADPNAKTYRGDGVLHVLTGGERNFPNRKELVEALLKAGADPNIRNFRGEAPLHLLLSSTREMPERKALLEALIAAGADPNLPGNRGELPILMVLNNSQEARNWKTLLETLLKGKANPNITNDRGESLVMVVITKDIPNRKELLETLLKGGADPNIVGNRRSESLLAAVITSHTEITGRMEILETLLMAGADPNAAPPGGRSPLKAVISSNIDNKRETLALLIKHGANPDKPDASGQLLLHEIVALASGTGQAVFEDQAIGLLDLIITPMTNMNARNREGKTPLGISFLGRRAKLAAYLRSKGGTEHGFKNASYDLAKAGSVTIFGLYSSDIYALDQQQCYFILRDYGVKFEALAPTPGVEIPIALQSPISGIAYRHVTEDKKFSIMDCRLAILLVGWAPVLKKHNVREIIHMRAYSPGARVGGHGRTSGHNHALALDVSNVIYEDKQALTIKGDWKDHRKLDPCAEPLPQATVKEQQLRRLACETGNFDLFSVILSPHYNKDHFDHLHMELDPTQQQYMR